MFHFSRKILKKFTALFYFLTDLIFRALKQRTDLSCVWKILADCCHFAAKLPEKYCYVYVISSLITTESKNNLAIIHRMELFDLATR